MSRLTRAGIFAEMAHGSQVRKYTGEPYVTHCLNVAMLVGTAQHCTEDMQIAAMLHDVVEDTDVRLGEVMREFDTDVAVLVWHLTDQFTKERYPEWNRQERKRCECKRLSRISPEAQTIKYADIIDNAVSIRKHDPNFFRIYRAECSKLLDVMTQGDAHLRARAIEVLKEDE
jgi:guanosine-3',5'-bis(diphosphate) 3'-pyrophosphohydrolase